MRPQWVIQQYIPKVENEKNREFDASMVIVNCNKDVNNSSYKYKTICSAGKYNFISKQISLF